MEFHQLRYFIAAAEDLSISAAAKRLHVTQPALSRQIAVLEGALLSGSVKDALRAAHAIKGAAANIGADQLRVLASELEAVVRSGGLEFAKPLLDRLRDAQVATRAALEAA